MYHYCISCRSFRPALIALFVSCVMLMPDVMTERVRVGVSTSMYHNLGIAMVYEPRRRFR